MRRLHQTPSVQVWAQSDKLSSDLCIVFEKMLTAILETSDRSLGQHRITKRQHETHSKRKEGADENSVAAVSDTEGSKSLDF